MHKRPAYLSANDIGKDFHSLFIFYFLAGGGKPTREGHMAKVGRSPTILGGFGVFHIFLADPFSSFLSCPFGSFFSIFTLGESKAPRTPQGCQGFVCCPYFPCLSIFWRLGFSFLDEPLFLYYELIVQIIYLVRATFFLRNSELMISRSENFAVLGKSRGGWFPLSFFASDFSGVIRGDGLDLPIDEPGTRLKIAWISTTHLIAHPYETVLSLATARGLKVNLQTGDALFLFLPSR